MNTEGVIQVQSSKRAISRVYPGRPFFQHYAYCLGDSLYDTMQSPKRSLRSPKRPLRSPSTPSETSVPSPFSQARDLFKKLKNTLTHRRNDFTPFINAQVSQQIYTWLQRCDREHDCTQMHQHDTGNLKLPGRLLNVKPTKDPNALRLDVASEVKGNRYLALSHCWGKPIGDQGPHWRTLPDNVESRMKGFKLGELPRAFQDAIEVTRALRIPYLWIDSICIIQGDEEDWNRESKRMEDVYASAYCTIAATAASNSMAGFLSGIENHQSLYVQDDHGEAIYISTNVADFDKDIAKDVDKDIEEHSLNERAWVMQERFLSPCTIHFTRTQIYGECGHGIYAGDNIFLRSTKYFQLDPAFPSRLRDSGYAETWDFLKSMLENYSQRGITKSSDRAIAISGLLNRIEKVLRECRIYHGIIGWYLHRTLLWRRETGSASEKIEYKSPVPSWSWMAYTGPVVFSNDPFGKHDAFRDLQFDERTIKTTIWEVTNPGIRCRPVADLNMGYQFQLYDWNGLNIGFISLDKESEEILQLSTVAILAKSPASKTVSKDTGLHSMDMKDVTHASS
ncbi:hypothetical protein PG991_009091 [Apiospora marii]|uniref:Heterokaryon incompatibility domain-containing protein n=1 Tax=Apiospora marii TaxID=335849 RepID=A0ABR1RK07_9PEZI